MKHKFRILGMRKEAEKLLVIALQTLDYSKFETSPKQGFRKVLMNQEMSMDYMMLVSQKVLVACNNGRVMKRGKRTYRKKGKI